MEDARKARKAGALYLGLVLGYSYALGVLELILQNGVCYDFLAKTFTFVPVLAALITRRATGCRPAGRLSLRVWKHPKAMLSCAFGTGILVALGAALYFLVFPGQYSGVLALDRLVAGAQPVDIGNPPVFAAVCVLIAGIMVPVHLIELGEELGWRGYLLWIQRERHGKVRAALINGLQWGAAHLPLIYFGFNYSLENPGAPWTNMLMMMAVCLVLGVLLSYATLATGNCMFAAIIHGAVNVAGELPVLCSVSGKSGLLGPNPSGLLSMAFLAAAAGVLLFRMRRGAKE